MVTFFDRFKGYLSVGPRSVAGARDFPGLFESMLTQLRVVRKEPGNVDCQIEPEYKSGAEIYIPPPLRPI